MYSEVRAAAPEGTAEVAFLILNVNQPGNPGPMYFDAVQTILNGDPVEPFALSSSIIGGQLEIRFPTQEGINYQAAYKSSLTNASWTPIESIVGDGNTNSFSYAVTNSVGFYRISAP